MRPPIWNQLALALCIGLVTPAHGWAAAPIGAAVAPQQIGNGQVLLGYQLDPTFGLSLVSTGDAAEPKAFVLEPGDLWTIELRDPLTKQVLADLAPSTTSFKFELQRTQSAFRATWKGVRSAALAPGESFDVQVSARAKRGDRAVELRIQVDASQTDRSLYAVEFPRIQFQERGDAADGILTYPWVGGWLLPDPMHNGQLVASAGDRVVHPGFLSMQYFSYYDSSEQDAANLYLATRDPDGHVKQFGATPVDHASGPDALRMSLRNIPEDNLNAKLYRSPFAYALGVLRGDWYDASRFYRKWALGQPWASKGPMRTNADFSDIVRRAPMFAVSGVEQCCAGTPGVDLCPCNWKHSSFQYWAGDLVEQRTLFGVTDMPTHIYNWERNAFDAHWGEWFPIQSEFQTHAPQVAAQGDAFAPYFMPLSYSTTAPGYGSSYVPQHLGESVETYALWDEHGQVVQAQADACFQDQGCSVPGQLQTLTLTSIDLASSFAANYTMHVASETAALGAKGIYLDVFTNAPSEVTYNPNLGHPVGGGSYYTEGKVQLVQDLRDHMRGTLGIGDYFVYGESNNELFLGVTELTYSHATGFSVDFGIGSPVMRIAPLFETVYHDHQITGTVAALTYPASFYTGPDAARGVRQLYSATLFMGNAPWAGSVLSTETMASLMAAFPGYADWIAMIQSYVAILKRDRVRTFVTFGERMRDPATTAAGTTLALPAFAPYSAEQPLVYASAWGRPDLDAAGVLFLNWTHPSDSLALGVAAGDQTFSYTIDATEQGLSAGPHDMTEVTASGLVPLGTVDLTSPKSFNLTVPAGSARFFMFD